MDGPLSLQAEVTRSVARFRSAVRSGRVKFAESDLHLVVSTPGKHAPASMLWTAGSYAPPWDTDLARTVWEYAPSWASAHHESPGTQIQ